MAECYGVRLAHAVVTLVRVSVYLGCEALFEEGDQPSQRWSADQPLEVRSTRMVIRAVESRSRDHLAQAVKERLMASVHPHRDGWLPAVAAEAPLSDQDADQQARFEFRRCKSPPPVCGCCYTVW